MKNRILAGITTGFLIAGSLLPGNVSASDTRSTTYYEVFVYSFYDSNGDGIGDLNGLYDKLDYINDGDDSTNTDLGCDGIWLMPIMPSTTYHKYDVVDYMDIDPEYGTLDDFKRLLAACHERGIRVIIDLPMNHSSSRHPWFQEAVSYLRELPEGETPDPAECPYVDYYNFYNEPQGDTTRIEGTNWYYESKFWSEMPDLNLGCASVRDEFDKIAGFWLELGVDGFRLDAAKEYYSEMTDKNIEVLSWFNNAVKSKKEDAYLVAEVWSDLGTYSQYYASGIDSCFDFAFAGNDGIITYTIKKMLSYNASSYAKALIKLQNTLSETGHSCLDAPFYTNHDMARSAGYYSGDDSEMQTKMAQALNLTMSGCAFLYYGEELGMKGSGCDENFRAPMYWSADPEKEGMCDGPENMTDIKMKYGSLEEQENDKNSIYQYVKNVISIRNRYPEIASGTVAMEDSLSGENICAIRKSCGDSEVLLLYNISDHAEMLNLSGIIINGADADTLQPADMLLTGEEQPTLSNGMLTLPAYSVIVLK